MKANQFYNGKYTTKGHHAKAEETYLKEQISVIKTGRKKINRPERKYNNNNHEHLQQSEEMVLLRDSYTQITIKPMQLAYLFLPGIDDNQIECSYW